MTFRRRGAGAAALLSAWSTVACAGGDAAPDRTVVRVDTVAGVPRVTSRGAGLWEEGDAWRVGEPVLTIGSVAGDARTTFGNVTGTVLTPGGRLYVADVQASEVRAFDRWTGEHVLTFGRAGEGPGEFRYLDALALTPAGNLVARDAQAMRISILDPEGALLRTFRLERPFFQLGNGDGLWTDDEGRIFDRTSVGVGGGGPDSLGVMVYAPEGEVMDTILAAVWESPSVLLERDGRPMATMRVPFEPAGHVTVGPDGTVYTALGDAYEIRVLDGAGRHLRTVRRDLPPPPLDGAERDSATAIVERRVRALVELGGGGTVSEWSLPRTLPFIAGLATDALGYLWVARDGFGGRAPTGYDVFDPDGRLLGRVDMPFPDFRVRQIGRDFVLGTRTDELDVERIVVLPLERGPSG